MRKGQAHSFERVRPDGRVLKTVGGPMPGGGYVMCFADVTAEARALAELERARAELGMRVEERTGELRGAIFREFERLPDAQEGGIGLGLAIVERTARLLDARISLDSRPGRGSRFSVALPRSRAVAAAADKAQEPARGASCSVLVVDDDAANRQALAEYLAGAGHRVRTASSAAEALASSAPSDVALLDFNLGTGPDGLDLAADLIARRQVARIALITAARSEAYAARAEAMGIAVFRKPLSGEALDRWLDGDRL